MAYHDEPHQSRQEDNLTETIAEMEINPDGEAGKATLSPAVSSSIPDPEGLQPEHCTQKEAVEMSKSQRRYKRRKALGLCACGVKSRKVYCPSCYAKAKRKDEGAPTAYQDNGLCSCGGQRDSEHYLSCSSCRERGQQRRVLMKREGRCNCGSPEVLSGQCRKCTKCRNREVANKQEREKCYAQGICLCGRELPPKLRSNTRWRNCAVCKSLGLDRTTSKMARRAAVAKAMAQAKAAAIELQPDSLGEVERESVSSQKQEEFSGDRAFQFDRMLSPTC